METALDFNLLRGLRVVESSAFIAAPLAGMTLAQYGAEVIRIDMVGGGIDYARQPMMPGGRSLYWTGLNKGKKSIAVDIRRPAGRELVQALVTAPGNGGVLLTNIGVPWLSHALLSERRNDLITCTIEGNSDGTTAVDYTVNCAAGFPAITGNGSINFPVNHALPAWDIACAYQAAFGIAAAAANRQATGSGAQMRLALSDVAFSTLSHLGMLAEAELLNQERTSLDNFLYGAFGKDFGTFDGHRVYVAAISLGQWKSLVVACAMQGACEKIEQEAQLNLEKEEDRFAARLAIAAYLEEWFKTRSFAEVREILNTHKVCWGPYQTVMEALARDPRLSEANPIFTRVNTAGVGSHLAAGGTLRIGTTHTGSPVPAPLLGQHTDQILQEVLGLSEAALGKLHDDGIVAGPDRDPLVNQPPSV